MTTNNTQQEVTKALELVQVYPTKKEAAEAMGLSVHAFGRRLRKAKDMGLDPALAPAPITHGMEFKSTTVQYDSEGNVIQEWRRLLPEAQGLQDFVAGLVESVQGKGKTSKYKQRKDNQEDVMKEICINDAHIGRLCWGAESGRDYDLEIAKKAVLNAVDIALGSASYGKVTLVFGGDTMHADNRSARTEKSGHALDMDGRYSKIVGVTRTVMQEAILRCTKSAPEVEVVVISGNHDWHASVCLRHIVDAFFSDCENVSVDMSPAPRVCRTWGNVMMVWAHGDCVRANKWPEVVAAEFPQQWAETKYRFVHLGHIHHRKTFATQPIQAMPGVTVEFLDALCTPDSWHCEHGYVGITPATQAFTHHKEWGMIDTQTITLDRALAQ